MIESSMLSSVNGDALGFKQAGSKGARESGQAVQPGWLPLFRRS